MTVTEIENYINENNEKSFAEIFNEFYEAHEHEDVLPFFRAIDNVVIEMVGAEKIAPEQVEEALRRNIIEFYNVYLQDYFCEFDDELINEWNGDYPLVIKLGYEFEQYQTAVDKQNEIKYLRPDIRERAYELIEKITASECEKEVYFSYKGNNGETVNEKIGVPYKKNSKPEEYINLLYGISMMLFSNGAMVVRELINKKKSNVYVVKATTDCTWIPVPAKATKYAFLHDENGKRLKNEPGVSFVEM